MRFPRQHFIKYYEINGPGPPRRHPPAHTTAAEYLEDVAHLHADSDDLTRRGLAVGCLSALGRAR